MLLLALLLPGDSGRTQNGDCEETGKDQTTQESELEMVTSGSYENIGIPMECNAFPISPKMCELGSSLLCQTSIQMPSIATTPWPDI